jgi:hypothetical protein
MKENKVRIADSNFDRAQAYRGLTMKNQSQMSKLIPMLQVGAKKTQSDEEVSESLSARLEKLGNLLEEFRERTYKLKTMHKVDFKRQMKRLTDGIEYVRLLKAEKINGLSKALRILLNELTSTREAVYHRELEAEDVKLSHLDFVEAELQRLYKSTQARISEHQAEIEGQPVGDPLFSDSIEKVIQDLTNLETPSLDGKPWTVGRMPIIPVPVASLSVEVLESRGFDVQLLGGYPIMKSQLVLGISRSHLQLTDAEKLQPVPRARFMQAAYEILTTLRKETKQKLTFVVDKPHGHKGGTWFWLMTDSELKNFMEAFPGQSLQLRTWGF